eukprot:9168857-Karenia_brevis.AAC.1
MCSYSLSTTKKDAVVDGEDGDDVAADVLEAAHDVHEVLEGRPGCTDYVTMFQYATEHDEQLIIKAI